MYRIICVFFAASVYASSLTLCFRQLGLDLVPRREFSMVDPDEISVTELYRLVSVLAVFPLFSD